MFNQISIIRLSFSFPSFFSIFLSASKLVLHNTVHISSGTFQTISLNPTDGVNEPKTYLPIIYIANTSWSCINVKEKTSNKCNYNPQIWKAYITCNYFKQGTTRKKSWSGSQEIKNIILKNGKWSEKQRKVDK